MRDSLSGVEEPVLVEEWRADASSTDPTATIVSEQHDGKDTNGAEEAERRSFLSGCARFQALMISEHVYSSSLDFADQDSARCGFTKLRNSCRGMKVSSYSRDKQNRFRM